MERLYTDNVGLICMWRNRYAAMCNATCDRDDLMQAGFLGLVNASKTWEPARGAWGAWASFYIRNAMRDALGLRKRRLRTVSLDAPLSDDADADTLGDMVADSSLPPVSETVEQAAVCRAIREAVAAIGDDRARGAIECIYLRGMSHAQASEALGIPVSNLGNLLRKGLAALAKDRDLRIAAQLDEGTRFHAYKGVAAFKRSMTSVVEDAVIWREMHGKNPNEKI